MISFDANTGIFVLTAGALLFGGFRAYGAIVAKFTEVVTEVKRVLPQVESLQTSRSDHAQRLAVVERVTGITR